MKKYIGISFILIAAAVIWWQWMYPPAIWRYRLTLEVETPEGLKTGSSVIEVQVFDGPHLNPEGASMWRVRGEAVVVDLGARGILFALLSSERIVDYPVFVVFDLFPWPGGPGGEITKKGRAFYQALRGKTEIPFEKLPMLVRFRDINDPMTVELVEPKNLTKSFGSGVRLAHAFLEMTRDPVTSKIDTELMWLEKSAGAVTGKTVFDAENPGPENYVTRLNFKRGIVK